MNYLRRVLAKIDPGWLLAISIVLLVVSPLAKPGLPATADTPIHLIRALEFRRAWTGDVLFPRWAPDLAYGYGYPLFEFAPPLTYLLSTLIQLAGFNLESSIKLLLILATFLYAMGAYLFCRDLFGRWAGLAAAAAYMLAPFALREALLYGGNYPQYLAIGLFPWALWAVRRTARNGRWRWGILAGIFFACIILSHLFQVLIFAPVFLLYGVVCLFLPADDQPRGRLWSQRSWPVLGAFFIGPALSAFFWLPAYIERAVTRAQASFYIGKSPYSQRFLSLDELLSLLPRLDTRAANPYAPLTLGVLPVGLALLALLMCFLMLKVKKGRSERLETLFFGVIGILSVFLTTAASSDIWRTVTILQVGEFPWRMLGLANLGIAVLIAAFVGQLGELFRKSKPWLGYAWCVGIMVAIIAAALPYLFPVRPFERYDQADVRTMTRFEIENEAIGTTTLGEYLPLSVTEIPRDTALTDELLAGKEAPERLDRDSLPGGASATRLEQTAATHHYEIMSPLAFQLRLRQYYFPGWRVEVDGREKAVEVEKDTGVLLVSLPAGRHDVRFIFRETPLRLAADGLSALTLLVLLLAGLRKLPWRKKESQAAKVRDAGLPLTDLKYAGLGVIIIGGFSFGMLPLLRPLLTISSPAAVALPAQHTTSIEFEEGIRLIGYDLERNIVKEGDTLRIVLYWETSQDIHRNYRPFVHLDFLNDGRTLAASTNFHPGDQTAEINVPTGRWEPGVYVRDEHWLLVPPGSGPAVLALNAGLFDQKYSRNLPLKNGGGEGQLAWLHILPAKESTPTVRAPASFEDGIELMGYSWLPAGAEEGRKTPELVLFWRAGQAPARDYTIFIHLLDETGKLAAGWDSQPQQGAYPSTLWLAGQTVTDAHPFPQKDIKNGRYRLEVGLYEAAGGRRLQAGARDAVTLGDILCDEKGCRQP
jgi:4-amino-4-deoxy-L-arabinose transferase-like glycosyltransferase